MTGVIFLRNIDPARKRARWYTLQLQARLFGGMDVVCRWGRIGNAGGAELRKEFATAEEADRQAALILRRRRRSGYLQIVAPSDGCEATPQP